MTPVTIRIVLADDHAQFRETLKALLERQADALIVACVGDGRSLLDRVAHCTPPPDLVVTDVGMPHLNGIEAVRMLRATHPGIRILALSMRDEPRFVAAMLAAGADGYALKSDPFDVLMNAIRDVAAGKPSLSPQLAPPTGP